MRRRDGFTLIELLIVVVVIGILAMIAANIFWTAKQQAFRSTMISDLKGLATLQEQYHARHLTYTTDQPALDFMTSEGVVVTILEATPTGWSAEAVHQGNPGFTCGLLSGSATNPGASPATEAGKIACN